MARVVPVLVATLLAMLASGCDALPRDPDGTLDRVRRARVLKVGVPAGFVDGDGKAAALVAAVASETGAKPALVRGSLEPLLVDLDADRIDLVVAPFSAETPWAMQAALGPPLSIAGEDADRIEVRAAMRGGENAWVVLVEKASRRVAPAAAKQ